MSDADQQDSQSRVRNVRASEHSKVGKSGGSRASNEVFAITHRDDWDTLLVRVGHHLWRWYKQAEQNHRVSERKVLEHALEDVWRVKREYRAPIREKAALVAKAAGERMKEMRRAK